MGGCGEEPRHCMLMREEYTSASCYILGGQWLRKLIELHHNRGRPPGPSKSTTTTTTGRINPSNSFHLYNRTYRKLTPSAAHLQCNCNTNFGELSVTRSKPRANSTHWKLINKCQTNSQRFKWIPANVCKCTILLWSCLKWPPEIAIICLFPPDWVFPTSWALQSRTWPSQGSSAKKD